MVLPEARIGEESIFVVRENDFDGRIALEMFKLDESTKRNNMLVEIIKNAGMSPTPEFLLMGQKLIENGLAVDSTTLQKMALFTHAKLDADSAIFLLRENMPIDSAKILQILINNPLELLHSMKLINCEFYFNPQNAGSYKPLKTYYRELYTQLRKLQKTQNNTALEILDFMNNFKGNRKFYQIPYLISDKKVATPLCEARGSAPLGDGNCESNFLANKTAPKLAELFTFGKGKTNITAILAMETNSLGRIEVFINNHNKLEFRGETDYTLNQLLLDMPKFTQSLSQTGQKYNATVKKLETPFTLVSPTPDVKPIQSPPQTRYTFDMRV